ncbi:MAG: hypothetical protein NZM35_04045 [Chitinophagales bacterium]|nr:hypothetical protein [Chitinophagales bacterium]MDW8418442.1 hypothetical protein [Chitinophagales bacterium]
MDTLSVTSSLGTSENLTWKDYRMKPNDTLFEFTPIPSNEEKGTAIYTLVIDSAIYR